MKTSVWKNLGSATDALGTGVVNLLYAPIAPYVFVRSATVTVAVTRGSWASAFFTGF